MADSAAAKISLLLTAGSSLRQPLQAPRVVHLSLAEAASMVWDFFIHRAPTDGGPQQANTIEEN